MRWYLGGYSSLQPRFKFIVIGQKLAPNPQRLYDVIRY
jgi:hypothetical protein